MYHGSTFQITYLLLIHYPVFINEHIKFNEHFDITHKGIARSREYKTDIRLYLYYRRVLLLFAN